MLKDIIQQAMLAYHEHVKNRMAEIPTGAFLCVHEKTDTNVKDDWKITFVVESHIVESPTSCDRKDRHTVYGPKPEDWPQP